MTVNTCLVAVLLVLLMAGIFIGAAETAGPAAPAAPQRGPLDPRGRIHIPIGIPNTVDTLKTFVEAEGCFSPGFATYGIYFWTFDPQQGKLTAPTQDGAATKHGLAPGGALIPWSEWQAGDVIVRTEVCQVRCPSPEGDVFVVGARAILTNRGDAPRRILVFAALRPLGPAGGPVRELAVSDEGDALLADGHPALVACDKPAAAGVLATDTVGEPAMQGKTPTEKKAASSGGDCSGSLQFDVTIPPSASQTLGFICPVLPGRRAVGHQWDGKSEWAQLDLAKPNPPDGGVLQPDPGLAYWRQLKADALFEKAAAYWKDLAGGLKVRVPDGRWPEALAAVLGHAAMAMNEGAPDVAVINYNVFNRDGIYTANILQKSGRFDLAEQAIDYFLAHPFNGRAYPEADNPGQVLWIMGEHWLFTRDRKWLARVYPGVQKLAAMIRYCRTTAGPHWVSMSSLKFGDALKAEERQELKPGRCDGSHPEYTEAFDVSGLWRAAILAQAMENEKDTSDWAILADSLLASYEAHFGSKLAAGYGSYCVLWPCRLLPGSEGSAFEQFRKTGAQKPGGWRYFPLATAHQGLLAGSREAGYATLAAHLDHEQMRGWYAFDEGGKSGPGGWSHSRTTWNSAVAMPHGWANAELWLLMRDCLLYEDGDRLVLLAGVPPEWLTDRKGLAVENMPTYFGPCSYEYVRVEGGAALKLTGAAAPADGFALRLPEALKAAVKVGTKQARRLPGGDFHLPAGTKRAEITFTEAK